MRIDASRARDVTFDQSIVSYFDHFNTMCAFVYLRLPGGTKPGFMTQNKRFLFPYLGLEVSDRRDIETRRARERRGRSSDMSDDDAKKMIDAHASAGKISGDAAAVMRKLIDLDQRHLFDEWSADVEADVDAKAAFAEQLLAANAGYPGGWPSTSRTRARC